MAEAVENQTEPLLLRPFETADAAVIAQWVETEEQLHWVAPSTSPPLTPRKVAEWRKPTGEAYVLVSEAEADLYGYGELNVMQNEPRNLWLGHLIVRPELRGRGVGQMLVRALLQRAFGRFKAKRVLLVVFPGNHAAIDCYQRSGFRITGEEFHRFGDRGPKHRLLRLEVKASDVADGTLTLDT